MILIPAIDLKEGRCVRLRQGRMEEETIFNDDPLTVAKYWVTQGARRLHIVDLDGAVNGQPVHFPLIQAIARACPSIPIQVGGGIREETTIKRYLSSGISYVILGTKAIEDPEELARLTQNYPQHMIVSLDAKQGHVATAGWKEISNQSVASVVQKLNSYPLAGLVYTNISHDGMMKGPDLDGTLAVAKATSLPVIASGGITDLADVETLAKAYSDGITAAIIGRALYEGTINFPEAQLLADDMTSGL